MNRRTFFCYACQCDKPESSKVYVSKAVVRCRACIDAAAECKRTGVYTGTSIYSTYDPYTATPVETYVDALIMDAYREAHED